MNKQTENINTAELMKQILELRFSDEEGMRLLCNRLLEIAEPENDRYGCAFANVYLLDYALIRGAYDSGRFYLMRAQALCEENGYDDLLLILHNIAGMYCQDVFEEQTAVQHYLRGLELAKEQNDPLMESKLLNNIGTSFSRRHDAADAATYFAAAFETLEPHLDHISQTDLRNAVSFLCNLAEAHQSMGRAEESEKALLRAEELHVKAKDCEVPLNPAWCGHYIICGDEKRGIAIAEQLLADGLERYENAYLKISAGMEVCSYMLDIGCRELALRYLELLKTCCGFDNLGDYYNYQVFRTRYYEQFGTAEEQEQAYQEFYEVSVRLNETNDSMRVQAELSKIELSRALLDRQAMRREKQELEDASHMDELTWLYNRRYLSKLLSKVAPAGESTTIGYIMLDVDYFKQYNDFYGHFKGDDALRCVADLLRAHATDGIYPSRYGGDEFLVLCVNWSDCRMEDYIRLVQAGLAEKKVPHEKSLCSQYLSLSVGYSSGTVVGSPSAERLLELADQALYEAKKQGRDRFVRA